MWFDRLLQGFIDTFLMVGVSSLIALLAGIPLAVILVTSSKGGIYEAPAGCVREPVSLDSVPDFDGGADSVHPIDRRHHLWRVGGRGAADHRGYTVLCAHCRGQLARGRPWIDRSGASHGLPALAHRLARVVAGSAAGDCWRIHDYLGDDDQFVSHGRGDWRGWTGGHRLSVWVSAV